MIARDLGVNPGTLGNWVDKDRAARGEADGLGVPDQAELKRLRSKAGLVRTVLRGRERVYQLEAGRLRKLTTGWISRFEPEKKQ